ncbi:MAG: SRPBCC family protein, partial [bacterium]
HYLLISLPPNFVGIMTYDSLGWLNILPEGSEHSNIRAGAIFDSSAGSESAESQVFTEAFFAEDKWICARVQRGMHSCQGSGGQLVEKERVVVDFHQYLASRLFSHTPTPAFQNPEPNPFQSSD